MRQIKRQKIILLFLAVISVAVTIKAQTLSSESFVVDGHFRIGQKHLECYVALNARGHQSLALSEGEGDSEFFVTASGGFDENDKLMRYTYTPEGKVASLSGRMLDLAAKGETFKAKSASPSDFIRVLGEPNWHRQIGNSESLMYFEAPDLYILFAAERFNGFSLRESGSTRKLTTSEDWQALDLQLAR